MKVMIIEDNEIEMENLKILLESFEEFQLVATADTFRQGADIANALQPEVILLDLQLECKNSLEHLDKLNYRPHIICVTLYAEHALQAFDVGARDYLTKPITREKLTRAFERLPREQEASHSEGEKGALLLRNGSKSEKVPIELIMLVTADRDYTTVRDEKATEFVSTRRMREWGELLPPKLFVTLDRSTIVNKEQIASYTRLGVSRTAKITFLNGEVHKIGSTALRRLKLALEE